jgi:hypothetical protein
VQMQGLHPAQLFALMGHAFPGAMQVLSTVLHPSRAPPQYMCPHGCCATCAHAGGKNRLSLHDTGLAHAHRCSSSCRACNLGW